MVILEIRGKVPAKSSSRKVIVHRRTRKIMVVSSSECYAYEVAFKYGIHKQMLDYKAHKLPMEGRLYLSIDWYADSYRQDIDSPPKILMDCLQKNGIIKNDNQFDYLLIRRFIDKKNPRVILYIGPHDEK